MSRTQGANRGLARSAAQLAAAAAIALLAGCTAQVRVAAPVAYVTPPPVVVAEPAVAVRVEVAPPPLPDYEQPPCPVDGWIWTPGYWGWGEAGYYWVPGTWVAPPRVGVLWTPGYWGFIGGAYVWHAGYWGPHVGFYGGVHYGFGYPGVGFVGGRWVGRAFAYNRSVTRVNVTVIHNTYNETVIRDVHVTRVSYNGGAGGIRAMASAEQARAAAEPHIQPTTEQRQHLQQAARDPILQQRANHGNPSIAATPRPAAFHADGVVRARGASAGTARPLTPANAPLRPAFAARQPAFRQQPNRAAPRPVTRAHAAKERHPPNRRRADARQAGG